MEFTFSSIGISLALVTLLTCSWRVLNWVWLRPKQLEKCLRDQGFKGNPYKLLFGDTKDIISIIRDARSKPMDSSSNNIVPRILPFHEHYVNIHGKNYFEWWGPVPRIYITDPKLIKEMLLKNEVFQKPETNPLSKLLVTGVLAYEGEKWSMHRKLLNPAFHLEKLMHMVPAMNSSCFEMLSKWEMLLSTEQSAEVDVWPYISNMSADVISRTAFGSNYDEGKEIFRLQKAQVDIVLQCLQSIYIPGWRFLPTKTNNAMKDISHKMKTLLSNIIINKRERMVIEGDGSTDLLGILLKTNLEDLKDQGNKKVTLTTEDVVEECKAFYLAGQETTSALVVWAMILLSKHQNWQALAREEISAVFGDESPDFDGLNRLKTVTMIINEVLRLYSPASGVMRIVHKTTKLGDLVIPPGTEIFVPISAIHQDREFWGEDAKEFNPERFSQGISKATKGQGTFLPFGGGPRICIGQNFAIVEAKVALAVILKRFSFELSPSYVHAPYNLLTVHPQHGAHLILHKI